MHLSKSNLHLRNILQLGGGTVLGQALVVCATPVITRMYPPDQMGLMGLFLAFVGFAGVASSLRLEMAIASAPKQEDADILLAMSFMVILPVSAVAGAVMYGMIRLDILSFGKLPAWTSLLMTATLALTGAFVALRYWFVRQQMFGDISRALVAQGGGRAVIPVVLGALGAGWVGLLAGEVSGRVLGIFRMVSRAWPRLYPILRRRQGKNFSAVLKRNIKYPLIGLPSSLIDALASALPLPLIASIHGTQAAGQYLLVQRLANLPASLIVASISDVYHPMMVQAYDREPGQLKALVARVAKRLLLLASVIYVPLSLLSPLLFPPLFGGEWRQAGWFMAILAPINIAALVVSPLSRVLFVVDRIERKLPFDVIDLLVPVASIYGMHLLGWDIYRSLAAFALLQMAARGGLFLSIWNACQAAGRP